MPSTRDYEALMAPMTAVREVSTRRGALLAKCGVETVWDALRFYPYRYEDYTRLLRPDQLQPGEEAVCYGRVARIESRSTGRGRDLVKVLVENCGCYVTGVFFNQKWIAGNFKEGGKVLFHGVCRMTSYGMEFACPHVTYLPDDFDPGSYKGERVPVYHTTEALPQAVLRRIMANALDQGLPGFREYLTEEQRRSNALMDLNEAMRIMHRPGNCPPGDLERARQRLVVDELFVLEAGLFAARKVLLQEHYDVQHVQPGNLIKRFLKVLPFKLTESQIQVLKEIKTDMLASRPMHRLLQGDVGSGKTVVAATALLMAIEGGNNAAIMAPTEILARQHYKTISGWCRQLGVDVALSVGSLKAREKKELKLRLEDPRPLILVGTHSLLHLGGAIPRLGLLVIDEQHKFGVAQRDTLRQVENVPDVLVMTATPIPRSLAMTVYGHMQISVLAKPPAGRKPIVTKVVTPDRLPLVWDYVRQQVRQGRQAYVVYPQIDESDRSSSRAAQAMYETLAKEVFPDLRVGLVHGRLKPEEKDREMEAFQRGETDILVATTVIEVGVDVPNASIMIIEDAQRFGLAQLHQLRGRIGRGGHASCCVLVDNTPAEEGASGAIQPLLPGTTENPRLEVMASTCDGFEIAEADLRLRGMGDFFGEKQAGESYFILASPVRDQRELSMAKDLANAQLGKLYEGQLADPWREALLTRLALQFGEDFRLPGF